MYSIALQALNMLSFSFSFDSSETQSPKRKTIRKSAPALCFKRPKGKTIRKSDPALRFKESKRKTKRKAEVQKVEVTSGQKCFQLGAF